MPALQFCSPGVCPQRYFWSGVAGTVRHHTPPAHGYRRKNRHGMEVIYDSNLDLYIVVGYPGYYYYDGLYYRKHDNQWESSSDLKDHWKKSSKHGMPKGLQNK